MELSDGGGLQPFDFGPAKAHIRGTTALLRHTPFRVIARSGSEGGGGRLFPEDEQDFDFEPPKAGAAARLVDLDSGLSFGTGIDPVSASRGGSARREAKAGGDFPCTTEIATPAEGKKIGAMRRRLVVVCAFGRGEAGWRNRRWFEFGVDSWRELRRIGTGSRNITFQLPARRLFSVRL
ncbi:MAG: hypothetical protein FWD68_16340 [Alphaproteobacteria bacterium]|nr:hypothetical protein [Alphaproteobacteria bacterium]